MQNKKTTIKKLIISLIFAGIFLGVIYLIFYFLGWTKISKEELQLKIEKTGVIAPLVFVLVSFLQVTFIPIPGTVTILVGNYLFGFWLSFLYSYIGMFLGGMFAYFLGKWIGRPFINWLAGSKEEANRWIKKLKGKEKVLLFFMFLLPLFPDDLLCSLAGILPITVLEFMIIQGITRITSIGGTLLFVSGEVIPFHGWGLVVLGAILVVLIVAFIICLKNTEKINKKFEKVSKIFNKKTNF
ncbi:MAG: TVP38/TMEM64 family protein [Clostridiales bacterium]|nr:TVP38/TMEM64 family protein [Clostridiales bacterium]